MGRFPDLPDRRDQIITNLVWQDMQEVADFLASPRHCYWFLANNDEIQKILCRTKEMMENGGRVARKNCQGIIVSFQHNFVEVHDGNASLVAWILYRQLRGESTLWKDLRNNCSVKAVLVNRLYETEEITCEEGVIPGDIYWHPYVPGDVECKDRLQLAPLDEKGKQSRKALTWDNTPVYFNDPDYFSGIDASETIGKIAEQLKKVDMVRDFLESSRNNDEGRRQKGVIDGQTTKYCPVMKAEDKKV
jgi:hypothetical protein